jgi:hypothetical protein
MGVAICACDVAHSYERARMRELTPVREIVEFSQALSQQASFVGVELIRDVVVRVLYAERRPSLQRTSVMSKTSFKVSAAVALFAVMSSVAQAQETAYATKSPIGIRSFQINESNITGMIGNELEQAPELRTEDFTLKFANTAGVAATTVKFVVGDHRSTRLVIDKGTFSPGVQIEHDFTTGDGPDIEPNATCSVSEVDFADGSVWRAASQDVAGR